MNAKLKSILATYAQALLACIITVMTSLNVTPFTMSKADWLKVGNAVWASFVPVIVRALNPKDTAFGLKSPTHR